MNWLTEELLQELKRIMKTNYGVGFSDAEAREFATDYIQVIDLLNEVKVKSSSSVPSALIDQMEEETIK